MDTVAGQNENGDALLERKENLRVVAAFALAVARTNHEQESSRARRHQQGRTLGAFRFAQGMFALSCEVSRTKRGVLLVEASTALQSYRRLERSLLEVKTWKHKLTAH